ncbi:MAG: universal stress protein [Thermodesulfovibrio sp.]|nr:universal stress protein [Thermodesulfovibrio sp.]MDW7998434.1 universal stress protein [Thermodesulfovibrio sp.]
MENPFSRILLPVDKSENSKKAIKFLSSLLIFFEDKNIELTLLNVVPLESISEKIKNVDFRLVMIQDKIFAEKIIEEYIKENIMPFLDDYERHIKSIGFLGSIKKQVEIGDPGNKIIEISTNQDIKTVMLARRVMSKFKKIILGSVSEKILYGLLNQNIYIIGQKISEENPIGNILIPVDGSEYSKKAVEHVVSLTKVVKNIKRIDILRIINVSFYLERVRQGIDPEIEAEEILSESKRKFINEGVSPELIVTKSIIGFPKDEIIKVIKEGSYDLIVMGRKGRSAIKDMVLGGVSSTVLNNCFDQTVAIINQ